MGNHSKYPKQAGIYKLTCNKNGKVYIGKSVNIYNRLASHKSAKDVGYLYNAIRKHGWESFTVDIIEIVENFDKHKDNLALLDRESHYIKLYESTDRAKGYNRCEFSNDSTGIEVSEETKSKLRMRVCSEETKEKMRKAMLGRKLSNETKEKISKARMGIKFSEETVEKMRSRRHSDEAKDKMRKCKIGRKLSDETKEKMSRAKLGKLKSDETKEKMRQANLGKVLSEETKEKIKETKRNAKNKIHNP